ncbi:hypothetical protein FRB94_011161 [Tulasnella sp. JGI-2019a]|nr:hypothetical protein FRB94_011161 [Tulasnella sp. JGI-2019a]
MTRGGLVVPLPGKHPCDTIYKWYSDITPSAPLSFEPSSEQTFKCHHPQESSQRKAADILRKKCKASRTHHSRSKDDADSRLPNADDGDGGGGGLSEGEGRKA